MGLNLTTVTVKYVPNYCSLSDEYKLQIVNENEAHETIYTFVNDTYLSVQGMPFPTSVTCMYCLY